MDNMQINGGLTPNKSIGVSLTPNDANIAGSLTQNKENVTADLTPNKLNIEGNLTINGSIMEGELTPSKINIEGTLEVERVYPVVKTQEKTAVSSLDRQYVTPDENYTLSKVTIDPLPVSRVLNTANGYTVTIGA